ncbi:unnamed protein product [Caretta caretta]
MGLFRQVETTSTGRKQDQPETVPSSSLPRTVTQGKEKPAPEGGKQRALEATSLALLEGLGKRSSGGEHEQNLLELESFPVWTVGTMILRAFFVMGTRVGELDRFQICHSRILLTLFPQEKEEEGEWVKNADVLK